MKKYFIIAAAAVAAMAACTKVQIDESVAPDKKIGFEVANYVAQTKANSSLATEVYNFKTYAYQFPALGSPVVFMDETIYAWKAADHTVEANKLTEGNSPIVEWSPVYDYYWPKTGTINFYSYAGTASPDETTAAAAAATSTDLTTVKFTYTDATIGATSNIMVADPAIGLGLSNANANAYSVDNDGNGADVTKGVPTLFHHMLTKVQFDVKLATTEAKKTVNTIWKVTVLDSYGDTNPIKSEIIPFNVGTLALTSVAGTNNGAWSPSIATASSVSSTAVLWTPKSGEKENISLSSEEMTLDAGAVSSGDAIQLLALRSVMPQLSSNVDLTLVYKVQAYHGTTKYLEEIRTVGIGANEAKTLADLSTTANTINWLPNKKIIYHIVIDPVSEKVTFDPAVENYDEVEYNASSNININNGGIIGQ